MISIYDSNLRLGIHKFPGIFLSFEKLSSKFLVAAGLAKTGDLKTNNADVTKKHNIFVIWQSPMYYIEPIIYVTYMIGNKIKYIYKLKMKLYVTIEMNIYFQYSL